MGNNQINKISIKYEWEWDQQWIINDDYYWVKLQEIANKMQVIYQETDDNKSYTIFDSNFGSPDKNDPKIYYSVCW